MKNIILKNIVALTTTLLYVTTATAQDTVKVIERTHDSVKVVERTITHDTEIKQQTQPVATPAPTPVATETATASKETPSLKRGEFGIRYMPTFSTLNIRSYSGDVIEGTVSMSHGIGAMLGFNISKHVGLQAEVNYYESSQRYKDNNLNHEVRISYLNIPILLSLNTNKTLPINFNVVAGPQFGLNVGSSLKTTGGESADTLHAVIALKQGDVGLAYGAGLEIALNKLHTCRLDFGYRGFYGLVDMNSKTTGSNTYNVTVKASRQTYSAYIGFTLLF